MRISETVIMGICGKKWWNVRDYPVPESRPLFSKIWNNYSTEYTRSYDVNNFTTDIMSYDLYVIRFIWGIKKLV